VVSEIKAPWTPLQVECLNRFQRAGFWHPFTCGKCSRDLVATPDGWRCPSNGCDYEQDWAHAFMALPPRCICAAAEHEPPPDHHRACPRGNWEAA